METRDYFRIEATELIASMTADLNGLSSAPSDPGDPRWQQLRRSAHTIKGAAHVVRQGTMATTAHALEDQLAAHAIPEAIALVDQLARMLEAMFAPVVAAPVAAEPAPAPVKATSQPATKIEAEPASQTARVETIRVELQATANLLTALAQSSVLLTGLHAVVDDMAQQREAIADALRELVDGSPTRAQEMLIEVQADGRRMHGTALDHWQQLRRQLSEVDHITHALRLTTAHDMLLRVERTARRAAEEAGISMEVELTGGEERIDVHLLTDAEEALSHMVRNAVAHGLRTRPSGGKISIAVRRSGARVVFSCADNGAGIDLEQLRGTAVKQGWMTADDARKASRAVLLELLTRPGISTRTSVNEMSGRGIGLDVARSKARELRGDLDIQSESGRGTTVSLTVPESLVSLSCLVLEVAGEQVAVPLSSVRRTVRFSGNLQDATDASGAPLPLLDGARLLGIDREFDGAIAVELSTGPKSCAGLAVDHVIGTEDLVTEPVPSQWRAMEWIAGTYRDGTGRPRLLLDPAHLHRSVVEEFGAGGREDKVVAPILVIDDSLTSRTLEESILSNAGYDVDTAMSAEEGLEKAHAREYGLFVVDVEMPGMDGFDFVRITRADDKLQRVPVIMITSRNRPGDRDRGLQLGASEYIIKGDFDQGKLMSTVAQLLHR